MAPESFRNKTNNQLGHYKDTIRRIREGRFKPRSMRLGLTNEEFRKLSDKIKLEIWIRLVNPERLAAIQIIIEEFFKSSQYSSAKKEMIESNNILIQDDGYHRIFYWLERFISENENPEIRTARTLLVNIEKIYGIDFVSSKVKYLGSIEAGFRTAIYFNQDLMKIIREEINEGSEPDNTSEANIVRAVRRSFQNLSTFFGSFPIWTHLRSLNLITIKGETHFNRELFEGDLKKGMPLRINNQGLRDLMRESDPLGKAVFRCPAMVSTDSNSSAMNNFALLYANMLLYQEKLITYEELMKSI